MCKKFVWGLLAILLTATNSYAQVQMGAGVAETSLNANATAAPQTGTAFAISSSINQITWNISFASAPGSQTTNLELSNDNSTWLTADTSSNVSGESRTIFTAAKFLRVTEAARSGGGAITVTVIGKSAPVATILSPISGQLLIGDGSVTVPALGFSSQPGFGFFKSGANILFTDGIGNAGAGYLNATGFSISATRAYAWGSGSNPLAIDTQLTRDSAGVVLATSAFKAGIFSSTTNSVLTINSNVIAPTGSVHHVGAGLVKTITVPASCTPTCNIDIVPDAAFTTDATGNISLASTAVTLRTMRFTWDGTKWNPSY